MTKLDWKKDEKTLYHPKATPEILTITPMTYLVIHGSGAPSSPQFQKTVETLFSLSYGLKFAPRKGLVIEGYRDYAVYPLEGFWDISDDAIAKGVWSKEDLVYTLMIRQPDFITVHHLDYVKKTQTKKDVLLSEVDLQTIEEGLCAQVLHTGSFESEPDSFIKLETMIKERGFERKSKTHKEIYLSDFNKTKPENLTTILRIAIEEKR
jgi:hypothetical protein